MHLINIKLVGFKSFVDVTSVPFDNEMTAIVGPNGCGKSNIIDAVRWVLGESSAKNLRGDSMTDVIFNGSASRKPVGQASVELVFDNRQSQIQGTFADRNEISIKRLVTRDGQNKYFLNGSKCRRKDITDIFLGTGLGPRSYAIIEQGMISKLIESKPQELRVFIEEAAGVSKYKERRRETELRIKQTRENLLRLADIKQELYEQLEKLQAQSVSANKFKELKQEDLLTRAELIAFRWQQCQIKSESLRTQTIKLVTDIEKTTTEDTQLTLLLSSLNEEQHKHNDKLGQFQQTQLQLTRDITRLEQNVQHNKQSLLSLEQTLQEILTSKESLQKHIEQQLQTSRIRQVKLEQIEPQLTQTSKQLKMFTKQLQELQHRQRDWQALWDTHQHAKAQYNKDVSVNESRLMASTSAIDTIILQLADIDNQIEQNSTSKLLQHYQVLEQENNQLTNKLKQHSADIECHRALVEKNKHKLKLLNVENQQTAHTLQKKQAQLDALSPMQLEQPSWQTEQLTFLQKQGVSSFTTLIEQLEVEPTWQLAVEMVIGEWLKTPIVSQWPDSFPWEYGQLICVNDKLQRPVSGSLAEMVSLRKLSNTIDVNNASYPLISMLNKVSVAQDAQQAKKISMQLQAGHSVICQQGYWYGENWFRKGLAQDSQNLLARQTKVKELTTQIDGYVQELKHLEDKQKLLTDKVTLLNNQQDKFLVTLNELHEQQLDKKQNIALLMQEITFKDTQANKLRQHKQSLEQTHKNELLLCGELLKEKKVLNESPYGDEFAQQNISRQRQEMIEQQDNLQTKISSENKRLQSLLIEFEQLKSEQANISSNLNRDQDRLAQLDLRYEALIKQKQNSLDPLGKEKDRLSQLLRENLLLDASIAELHQSIKETHEKSAHLNLKLSRCQKFKSQQSEQLNKKQLAIETLKIRAQGFAEQMIDTQHHLDDILAKLPNQISEGQWQIKLEKINKKIMDLGAINLAAISEYELQQQRYDYLQQQCTDLENALSTLESAIKKIDNESRDKFKSTFDKVNGDLKVLFPKVFGGGSAYLDLTSNDLLETGVTIMARPPGKKNSTIHLLSGGEKALTALSLVFAIFRLNPAPFCMLDEVDAPLDDANVGRFCNLVKEMSQTVQFIYISHNKIAMEMASKLSGVTMFEPGVSKMVAVDIDDAVAMAEKSK